MHDRRAFRSNRNRGTKILRCFPHCCPHHVDRSYCGSSLEVVLRFGSDLNVSKDNRGQEPFDVANVFVFARFEAVGSKLLGGEYSLHQLRSLSQSEVNPEASWVEGVRQTASDGQQHSQQLYGSQPASRANSARPEPATFVLNGQAFAKWYYHWESGANKVQRATKHALKAYVFYQIHAQYHHNQFETESAVQDGALELLCVVTSPPFTVVSYRRAPLDATASPGGLGLEASTALVPHYATDTAHPVDSRLRRLVQHQISRAFQEYNQQQQETRSGSGFSDESFKPFREQDESRLTSGDRSQYDRYRQLQERGGLRFRLLTPADAALSSSSLHGQIQPREPRLVFDSTRRREENSHWRESGNEKEEDEDIRDEAVAQPLTSQNWTPSSYELMSSALVGMPPPTRNPLKQAERAASVALLRFKQQQRHFDNHQREIQQLMDLAIVHFFVSHITNTRSPANLEVVFTIAISQHWRYPSDGATQLARVLLATSKDGTEGATASTSNTVDENIEELTLVLAEVCVWFFSPENIELMQSVLTVCHPLLLDSFESSGSDDDGKELRTAFLDCAGRCWNALDAFLQTRRATQTTIRGVRGLSDAVLGVVYSDPELEELRSGLRMMLQRPTLVLEDSKENTSGPGDYGPVIPRCNPVGWQAFVAQVREGYLRDQYSGRGFPWNPIQGATGTQSRWTADWLLQPDSLSVTRHARLTDRDVPSMWTSCLALSQLLHLKFASAGDPLHTLYVQAEPSVLSRDNAWLRLICDGRVRVAPVSPNGLTSLVGGTSCGFGGDYVAFRLEHGSESLGQRTPSGRASDDSSLCVEFYWWPFRKTQGADSTQLVAFRSVLTLKTTANGAFLEGQMDLEHGFVDREAIASADFPDLEHWAPTERVQAVTSWEPWLLVEGLYARK
ncbi:hypothetical protein V7S43_018055 [Phytophthora oleae]|uniref:TLDc domain-containing protein n=1 Tax=Phytophthora oleae TaxID=2107226 RepID=A0ABD3ETK0_9STRA